VIHAPSLLTQISRAKLKSEDNLDVKYVQLDITDVNSVQAAKKVIESAEGKLDVLVNNAGKRATCCNVRTILRLNFSS